MEAGSAACRRPTSPSVLAGHNLLATALDSQEGQADLNGAPIGLTPPFKAVLPWRSTLTQAAWSGSKPPVEGTAVFPTPIQGGDVFGIEKAQVAHLYVAQFGD